MEKLKAIELFSELIEKLYQTETLSKSLLDEIDKDLDEILDILPENRFYREIKLMIKTAKQADEERRDYLKIAIISDLEKELKRLKEI